jgi:signal transduction histidine kinase
MVVDMEQESIVAAGGVGAPPDFFQRLPALPRSSAEMTIQALKTGRTYTIPDGKARMLRRPGYEWMQPVVGNLPWESIVVVPAVYRGRPVGALNVGYPVGTEPAPAERALLNAAAAQAALAIENLRLFDHAERRVRELEGLRDVAASITLIRPIDVTLEMLAGDVVSSTRAAACSVVLFDPETLQVELAAGHGMPEGYMDAIREAFDNPGWSERVGQFLASDAVFPMPDVRAAVLTDPLYAPIHRFMAQVDWESSLVVPLRYQGQTVGALNGYFRAGEAPDQRDVDFLRAIADQASVAVQNARLYSEAEQRAREQQALRRIAAELLYARPLGDVLNALARTVVEESRAMAAAVIYAEGDVEAGTRSWVGEYGLPAGYMESMQQAWQTSPAYWRDEARAREPAVIVNAREHVRETEAYGPVQDKLGLVEWDIVVRVPFVIREQPRGAIVFYLPAGPRPDAGEVRFFEALAAEAATVVENARLFTQVQERTRQLSALYRADEELHRSLKIEDVLHALLAVVVDTLGADDAAIVHWDEDVPRPILLTAASEGSPIVEEVLESFAHQGRAAFVEFGRAAADVRAVEDTATLSEVAQGRTARVGIRSLLEVPIRPGDGFFGMLEAVYLSPHRFNEEEVRLFSALARRASLAIENAQLYEQAQALAAVEERQRLARELHDSVSQALYGIALGARTARTLLDRDPATAKEPVEYVLSLAEAGLAEMRALIFELRPESLATEGLVAAIEKQVNSTRARYGIAVDAQLPAEPDVPLAVKEAIYRVAQEALHNVVKHARASHVELVLDWNAERIRLHLHDNGLGFDPAGDFPGHLGMRSMRERVTRLGGRFTVTSAPGEGARLHAEVPLS